MVATPTEKIIHLKALCAELKIDPREARQKMRVAVKDAKKFLELAQAYQTCHPPLFRPSFV